jgi:acylphosphatase
MATRLIITGVVQGVGYRQWACRQAERLGLTGWVRNRRDGSVEAIVAGDDAAVATLIEAARRGPPAASVSGVDTASVEGSFTAFEWRATE